MNNIIIIINYSLSINFFFIAFYKVDKIIFFKSKYYFILECLYYIYFIHPFKTIQFSFTVLPYITILKLLVNLNTIVVPLYNFSKNI